MLLINLLINLPHDEVYQNEISRSLPSLLFSAIVVILIFIVMKKCSAN